MNQAINHGVVSHTIQFYSKGDVRRILESRLDSKARKLVFAEVTRHRITRQHEDTVWLKFVNTTNRKVYCMEVLSVVEETDQVTSSTSTTSNCGPQVEDDLTVSSSVMSSRSSSRSDLASTTVSSSTSTGTLTEDPGGPGEAEATSVWRSCNICLEEMSDSDLICHIHCTAQVGTIEK